jgi:hypothetical protein
MYFSITAVTVTVSTGLLFRSVAPCMTLVPYLDSCDLRLRHTRGWVPRVSHFMLSGGWYGLLSRCCAPSQIDSFRYWIMEYFGHAACVTIRYKVYQTAIPIRV